MLRASFILIFITLMASTLSFGSQVESLFIWRPLEDGPRFILPQKTGHSDRETIEMYRRQLNTSPLYQSIMLGMPLIGEGKITRLAQYHSDSRLRVALIANRAGHMFPGDPFLNPVFNAFKTYDADVYVIPLGIDLILDKNGLREYIDRVADLFPGLIAAGGFHVHHALHNGAPGAAPAEEAPDYPEYNRDVVEMFYMRHYIDSGKGVCFCICRGHQLWGVLNGHGLQSHEPGTYSSEMLATLHANDALPTPDDVSRSIRVIIKNLSNGALNVLQMAFGPETETYPVRVRHHYSVVLRREQSPDYQVVALDARGTVEVVQSLDGRVVSVQYHSEDLHTEFDHRFIRWLVGHIREFRARARSSAASMMGECAGALGGEQGLGED